MKARWISTLILQLYLTQDFQDGRNSVSLETLPHFPTKHWFMACILLKKSKPPNWNHTTLSTPLQPSFTALLKGVPSLMLLAIQPGARELLALSTSKNPRGSSTSRALNFLASTTHPLNTLLPFGNTRENLFASTEQTYMRRMCQLHCSWAPSWNFFLLSV